jgi:hypothetical protein
MPSMSYCAMEITAGELEATVERIQEKGERYLKSVNRDERDAYLLLLKLCRKFIELHEEYEYVIEWWSDNDPVDDDDEDWRSW